ncbi:Aldo/keto reductase family-domain-containing protein [Lactarius quietus]|nr:Aldo/keto reductase family-domain-containing protein [Lactarius quietus]
MGMNLNSQDTVIIFPPIESIPDGPEDKPTAGPLLEECIGPLNLPQLVSGAAAWSSFYNKEETLSSDIPLRTIRLALRYGIRAFDTAPYYDDSEIVLGTALKSLELEFPRGTYQLITKVGRYGPSPSDFDYSPTALRTSVQRSLRRLYTQYLDIVYLHDVEFVAPCVAPRAEGNHSSALGDEGTAYGLETREAEGSDERVLEAISTLRAMQAEGLIRHIGISGPHPIPSHPISLPSPTNHCHSHSHTGRPTAPSAPAHSATRTNAHRPPTRRSTVLRALNAPERHAIRICRCVA